MFAEQGSFFVIPGPWFNTNPSDTHSVFESDVAAVGLEAAQRRRFESFGNSPAVPFFGEPLAVRVSILGAISENMPAPMSMQSEWLKKWGWLPRRIGGTGLMLPQQFVPAGFNLNTDLYVPNFTVSFDPVLATASDGMGNPLRRDRNGWTLPAMPRLPVSPTLLYYGEVNP